MINEAALAVSFSFSDNREIFEGPMIYDLKLGG